jgi:hypothetical protein
MNPVKLQDVPTQVFRLKAEVFGTSNSELITQNSELRVPPVAHVLLVSLTPHDLLGFYDLGFKQR